MVLKPETVFARWGAAIVAGLFLAFCLNYFASAMSDFTHWYTWSLINPTPINLIEWLALAVLIAFSMATTSFSVVLTASSPPVLTRTTRWFGRYEQVRQVILPNPVSAHVKQLSGGDSTDLAIQVQIAGGSAKTLISEGYSKSKIPRMTAKCTEIARFLKIEDRGYTKPKWSWG
ncbi:MAG TPA: hypothetical protein VN667_11515 [Burkholderiales bacterium]|nr:hypothetical protein [Burkholderiales bacterium]